MPKYKLSFTGFIINLAACIIALIAGYMLIFLANKNPAMFWTGYALTIISIIRMVYYNYKYRASVLYGYKKVKTEENPLGK